MPATSPQFTSETASIPANTRAKRVGLSLVAAALWAAGFVVWPGCATPPLPSSRTPVSNVQRSDVAFVKRSRPMKGEVIARLGKPDEEYADLRVACYHLNHLSRHRLMLFLGVVPMGTDEDSLGLEIVMFQFDDQGKMLRHTRRTVRHPYSGGWVSVGPTITSPGAVPAGYFSKLVRTAAEEWVRGVAGKS